MADKTLTITFRSDARGAISGVKKLKSELNQLEKISTGLTRDLDKYNSLFKSVNGQSVDISPGTSTNLQSAINSAGDFVGKLQTAQGLMSAIVRSRAIRAAVGGWVSQIDLFNAGLREARNNLSGIRTETQKQIQILSKPLRVDVVAKNSETSQNELENRLNETLKKRIELENQQIKQQAARERQIKRVNAQRVKDRRLSQAEGIIQELSTQDRAIQADTFRTGAVRNFQTESFIARQEQRIIKTQDRRERASTAFGTQVRKFDVNSERQKIIKKEEQQINKLFGDRLKQHKKESDARMKAEEKRQRMLDKEAQKEAALRLKNLRKFQKGEGNLYAQGTGNRGLGFGASNLKSSATAVKEPGIFGTIGGFAEESALFRLPGNTLNVIDGAKRIGSAMGAANIASAALAGTISAGIVGALVLAQGAAAEFSRQMEVAKKDQLSLIGVSEEVQRLYGVQRAEADEFYEMLQSRTEIAAKNTSVETADVVALNRVGTTAYVRAYQDTGKSLDELSKKLVETNTRFSILGQSTPGVTGFQIQNAYTSAISGDLASAVKRQEFFRNSGFGDVIRQVAIDQGIELAQASQTQQIEIFEEALKRRVGDDLINRAQDESIEAQMSAFHDRLFAQRTGIFGIQRDLDPNIEGNQSLFSEVAQTINLIFGDNGLFASLGKAFGGQGIDLLAMIRDGVRFINSILLGINRLLQFLGTVREFIANIPIIPGFLNVGEATNKAFEAISPFALNSETRATQTDDFSISSSNAPTENPQLAASFLGNIPRHSEHNFTSLFSALDTEKRNSPPGSKLLVANDSEFIFPDENSVAKYYENVIAQASPPEPPRTQAPVTNTITVSPGAIVVSSNQSPSEIADEVIYRLNNLFELEVSKYVK